MSSEATNPNKRKTKLPAAVVGGSYNHWVATTTTAAAAAATTNTVVRYPSQQPPPPFVHGRQQLYLTNPAAPAAAAAQQQLHHAAAIAYAKYQHQQHQNKHDHPTATVAHHLPPPAPNNSHYPPHPAYEYHGGGGGGNPHNHHHPPPSVSYLPMTAAGGGVGGYASFIGSERYTTTTTANEHSPPTAKRQRHQQQQQQQLTTSSTTTTTGTKQRNVLLNSIIIPSPSGGGRGRGGVQQLDSKRVFDNVTRRVRNECRGLCLLPSDDFESGSSSGGDGANTNTRGGQEGYGVGNKKKKSSNEWLRCAVSLVFSSLNLESPNPVGWDDDDDDDVDDALGENDGRTSITTTTNTTTMAKKRGEGEGGSPKHAHWCTGIYPKLCGPQPWQCTRPFITQTIYQLLLAEGYTDWLISEHRWGVLEGMVRPVIGVNLVLWKPSVFQEGSALVEEYSKRIWRHYRLDQLRTIKECEEALVPPQIGFAYVCHVANSAGWSILRSSEDKEEGSAAAAAAAAVGGGEEIMASSTSVVEVSPDDSAEQVMCIPVGEANNGGYGFAWEDKWTCDYCSESFTVYDEAVAHETVCKAKSQSEEEEEAAVAANDDEDIIKTSPSSETKQSDDDGDTVDESNVSVEYAMEDEWKCDYCTESFSLFDEAVAHEAECKAKPQGAEEADEEDEVKVSAEASGENTEGYDAEKRWRCDYCPESFSVYDEAVAHETECEAKSQEEEENIGEDYVEVRVTNVGTNQSSVGGVEGYIVEEKWKCDYCFASFSVYDEAVSHESECKAQSQSTSCEENQTSDESGEKSIIEQWKCDYCEAQFSDFDEAAAHEAECKLKSDAETSSPARSSVSNRDAVSSPQHAGTLSAENGTDFVVSKELRSSLLKTVKRLQHEYFPLMRGGDEKLDEVCEKVLRCMHAITPITKEKEVTSKKRVESVLNHLEHKSGYLSTLNEIFRVRVNTAALMDDNGRSESPAETVRSMSSESEDPEAIVVTYGLNSNGDQVIMAANSPERATQGAAKSRMPQHIDVVTPCGECILCNAPNCERCFACLSTGRTGADAEVCIRKSCCKIPFEYKAKSLVGFPPDWQYAFCDPIKGALVKSPRRILSLAGLVIRRPLPLAHYHTPTYQYFYSFEAAFSAVQHEDTTSEATNLVQSFLSHIHGSDAMRSYPNHFLVGRRFCFEFTNVNGMNVAMFGVISTCFRESSEAENDIFMVQYDSDCLEIAAESYGTNVPRLQLISSQRAWGGCISFERMACIRGRNVVRSIDQATAVEYWVTPDMRMEGMVEQENGIKAPQLTILLRGYKFVFSAHNDHEGTGVSLSCMSMNVDDDGNDVESILKPGGLIDLGVFCPLLDSDTKPLSVFILKNYLLNFKIDSYAGDGSGNVYDLTEDARGTMHLAAAKKVLSYVRSCDDETEIPTIHGGLDPSGKVHLLFGVRYHGDWKEYTSTVEEEIHPIFRGERKEVTLAPNLMINQDQEARYLSAVNNFGPEELVHCAKFFGTLFLGSSAGVPPTEMRERSLRVAACLRHRIAELGDLPSMKEADEIFQRAIDQVKALYAA